MTVPLGQVILDLCDAGAVHLRCVTCGETEVIGAETPETGQHAAGVWLATLITWSIRHRCTTIQFTGHPVTCRAPFGSHAPGCPP